MACSYTLVKQGNKQACKLCKVVERMDANNLDGLDIDTSVNSHIIECVATVSFDRQRRQFRYTGDQAGVFGQR